MRPSPTSNFGPFYLSTILKIRKSTTLISCPVRKRLTFEEIFGGIQCSTLRVITLWWWAWWRSSSRASQSVYERIPAIISTQHQFLMSHYGLPLWPKISSILNEIGRLRQIRGRGHYLFLFDSKNNLTWEVGNFRRIWLYELLTFRTFELPKGHHLGRDGRFWRFFSSVVKAISNFP